MGDIELSVPSYTDYIIESRRQIEAAYKYIMSVDNFIKTSSNLTDTDDISAQRDAYVSAIRDGNNSELSDFNNILSSIATMETNIHNQYSVESGNIIEIKRMEHEKSMVRESAESQLGQLENIQLQQIYKQYLNVIFLIVIIVVFGNMIYQTIYGQATGIPIQSGGMYRLAKAVQKSIVK